MQDNELATIYLSFILQLKKLYWHILNKPISNTYSMNYYYTLNMYCFQRN